MKIYNVEFDVDTHQSLSLVDRKLLDTDVLIFDGTRRAAHWTPPAVYSYKPKLKAGDFWALETGGAFVTTPEATDKLQDFLHLAGELLPLPFDGKAFTVLNITECIDCLDRANVTWVYGMTTGKPIRIQKYAFHADRMSESSIFKIPETAKSQILCYEGLKDPEDEFKVFVEQSELTGIYFDLLWDSDLSPFEYVPRFLREISPSRS